MWDDEVVSGGVRYSYHYNYIYQIGADGTETAVVAYRVDDGANIFTMKDQTPLVWYNEMPDRQKKGGEVPKHTASMKQR